MPAYRSEIDGLRALAVVPVILFHANFSGFSGGYVGVDVFFVISGYLITALLVEHIEAGHSSIVDFYERRARRILPALFFIVLCTVPFAYMWMLPSELVEYAHTLVSIPLFVTNFVLFGQSGYFSVETGLKPLFHIWSLAVEEQFYILFPLFLLLIYRFGTGRTVAILAGIGAFSLLFAQFGGIFLGQGASVSSQQWWASYLLPIGRVWELLLGAACAIRLRQGGQPATKWSGALAGAGLGLIVLSIVAYGPRTPFPSVFTLVPTVGTALIILFAHPSNGVGRLLSLPFFVGIGLISYSAYLWHQPLFAFARLRLVDGLTEWQLLALAALSLGLGWLSWRFVEKPFRHRSKFRRWQIVALSAVFGAIIVGLGLVGHYAKGFPERIDAVAAAAAMPAKSTTDSCSWQTPLPDYPLIKTCAFGAPTANPVLLFGDSHADALYVEVDRQLGAWTQGGLLIKNPYCPPVFGLYDRSNMSADFVARCERTEDLLYARLATHNPSAAVAMERWTYRAFPVAGLVDRQTFDNGEGGVEPELYTESYSFDAAGNASQSAEVKSAAIVAAISKLKVLHVPVVLVYPVPETGWDIPRRNHRRIMLGLPLEDVISTDYARYEARHKFVIDTLDAVDIPNVRRVRPSELLCNTDLPGRCLAQKDGVPLYYDDDHLNLIGSAALVQAILDALE